MPMAFLTRCFEYKSKNFIALLASPSFLLPPNRCLIKDFELRPNVLDLLQHVFIKQIVGREKILQKQLIELIDLNQQMGAIEKTRYLLTCRFPFSHIYHVYLWHVRSRTTTVCQAVQVTHHKMFDTLCYKPSEEVYRPSCQ